MTIFKCHTIFDHVRKIPENTKIISYKGNPSVFRSLLNYIFNMYKIPENTNRSSYWNSRPKIFWKCNYFETFTEVTGKFFVILHFEKAAYFFSWRRQLQWQWTLPGQGSVPEHLQICSTIPLVLFTSLCEIIKFFHPLNFSLTFL